MKDLSKSYNENPIWNELKDKVKNKNARQYFEIQYK